MPFNTLNSSFNAIVSTSQVGLDEAPTQAMIDSWEDACRKYDQTVMAWKKMQSQDLAAFNTLLQKNNLESLQLAPSTLADPPYSPIPGRRSGSPLPPRPPSSGDDR